MLALLLASSCAPAGAPQRRLEQIAVVAPDAGPVTHLVEADGGLSYSLLKPHPPAEVLGAIRNHIQRLGWAPVETDFADPSSMNSHVLGWGCKTSSLRDDDSGYAWCGDWRSPDGEVVRFVIVYRFPEGLLLTDVHATYWSRQTVLANQARVLASQNAPGLAAVTTLGVVAIVVGRRLRRAKAEDPPFGSSGDQGAA